ncbi:MAG TPA: TolC family protein, partial [Bacteroidia bacterium]|nr:TolC family protein [Bacteroidia bacterium]
MKRNNRNFTLETLGGTQHSAAGNCCLRYLILSVFILVASFHPVLAQDSLLTLDKAIEISMVNNYDVRITAIEKDQNKNSDHAGMAGMLPRVDLNGTYSKSSQNTKQSYASGLEVNRDNVGSDNLSANATLSWIVFDGLKMFATREKLGELYLQSEEKLKVQMENTLQAVISAYYSIVQQKQLLKSTREEILFAEERVRIAERRMHNGSGSRLEYLQTRTDLNALRSAELSQLSAMESARVLLNQCMTRDLSSVFDVEDTIIISYNLSLPDLRTTVIENNHSLKYFKKNEHISSLDLKEIQAVRLPRISLNGSYQFTKVENEVGFVLLNQN